MLSAFQPSAFQNNAFQIDSEGGPPTPPAAPQGPTPAGRSQRERERRRYILPDGTVVSATRAEITQLLQRFAIREEVKIVPRSRGRYRKAVARIPAAIEEADIQWKTKTDASEEILQPILPPEIKWQPKDEDVINALRMLRRRADDEEAMLVLML